MHFSAKDGTERVRGSLWVVPLHNSRFEEAVVTRNPLVPLSLLILTACGTELDGSAAAQAAPPPAQEIEARRVWSGGDFNFYVEGPSPDGRLHTDVDWTNGDLAVRDLETGQRRRVTDKGTWSESDDYAEYAVFSPDGSRIAYSWFKGERGRPEGTIPGYELRSIGVDGSDMRVHFPARADVRYVTTYDWSRDGRTVLVTVARRDRTRQIGLVSMDDGSYRILKSTDWRNPLKAGFSPDGRWIAFDFPPDEDDQRRDIFALATDGSREIPLVEGGGHNRFMGWLPDGSGILFHRQTDELRALYRLEVRDGRPVGGPVLVKPDVWSVRAFGFSRDAFFYGVNVEWPQIHIATIDLEAGRALSSPEPIVNPADDRTEFAAWSPDAQSLAYLVPNFGTEGSTLFVKSLTGEVVRQMPVELQPAQNLQWVPGGLFSAGTDIDGRMGVYRIDLDAERVEPVMQPERELENGLTWSYAVAPDGQTVYWRSEGGLYAYDVAGRRVRTLARDLPGRRLSVSPDGSLLAMPGSGPDGRVGIWVMPATGGTPRLAHELVENFRGFGNRYSAPFTPDGRSVLTFGAIVEDQAGEAQAPSTERTLYRIPLDGSAMTPILKVDLGRDFALSPDGKRIAFSSGRALGEIWRLRGIPGFGPNADAGQR
jgi:Tol biopolymer transport system component